MESLSPLCHSSRTHWGTFMLVRVPFTLHHLISLALDAFRSFICQGAKVMVSTWKANWKTGNANKNTNARKTQIQLQTPNESEWRKKMAFRVVMSGSGLERASVGSVGVGGWTSCCPVKRGVVSADSTVGTTWLDRAGVATGMGSICFGRGSASRS